jgi:hypothetical protein
MLNFIVTHYDTYRPLELRHKWLMQVLAGFANPAGRCWPSREQIAEATGEHLSWVKRCLPEALALGYLTREPRAGGGYVYTIAERFRPTRPPLRAVDGGLKQAPEGPILSVKGPKTGPEVYLEENSITPLTPLTARRSRRAMRQALAPDDRERRQAEGWVRDEFWLRDGTWGPRPDQPGCTLPPDLLAWCIAERAKRSALVARVASAHSGRQEESLHARREVAAGTGTGLPTKERLHALRGV